jgi:hypothetical protein
VADWWLANTRALEETEAAAAPARTIAIAKKRIAVFMVLGSLRDQIGGDREVLPLHAGNGRTEFLVSPAISPI